MENPRNVSSENYENAPPNLFTSPSKKLGGLSPLSPSPKRARGLGGMNMVETTPEERRNSMENENDVGNDSFLSEDFRSFTDFDDELEEGESGYSSTEKEEETVGGSGRSRVMDVDDVFQLDGGFSGVFHFFLFLSLFPCFPVYFL